jgi:hypothetical protein
MDAPEPGSTDQPGDAEQHIRARKSSRRSCAARSDSEALATRRRPAICAGTAGAASPRPACSTVDLAVKRGLHFVVDARNELAHRLSPIRLAIVDRLKAAHRANAAGRRARSDRAPKRRNPTRAQATRILDTITSVSARSLRLRGGARPLSTCPKSRSEAEHSPPAARVTMRVGVERQVERCCARRSGSGFTVPGRGCARGCARGRARVSGRGCVPCGLRLVRVRIVRCRVVRARRAHARLRVSSRCAGARGIWAVGFCSERAGLCWLDLVADAVGRDCARGLRPRVALSGLVVGRAFAEYACEVLAGIGDRAVGFALDRGVEGALGSRNCSRACGCTASQRVGLSGPSWISASFASAVRSASRAVSALRSLVSALALLPRDGCC